MTATNMYYNFVGFRYSHALRLARVLLRLCVAVIKCCYLFITVSGVIGRNCWKLFIARFLAVVVTKALMRIC